MDFEDRRLEMLSDMAGETADETGEEAADDLPLFDLDSCPRCGERIERIIWGQTNCPRCGLHFECC